MKKLALTRALRLVSGMIPAFVLALGSYTAAAYQDYSGCAGCHGSFLSSTSPRGTVFPGGQNHEMHRSSTAMGTECNLCHFGTSRTPVYTFKSNGTTSNQGLGCSGCHQGPGLREHHNNNGVTECYECHNYEAPAAENVKPPYYGTADTKANNPGNPVQVANTNENWSIGDYIGLDNDGNNLYDVADYAVGPFQLLSAAREGNDMRVTWQTAGGRTNTLQAAEMVNGTYANVGQIVVSGVGVVTTNYLEIGGATNTTRFYKVQP
jgi:hypothetical protein